MSICKDCFHSYVCEQFNEHRECDNTKCHFFNDHFVPAEDVVKVVRCKDCKYYKTYEMSVRWNGKTKYCCRTVLLKVNPTDFCSYGELKEREG